MNPSKGARHPGAWHLLLLSFLLVSSGCARLFGWDIHAPGVLSQDFPALIQTVPERIALYLPPEIYKFESKDRGSWSADPQTYHVGESLAPMLVEGFQQAFTEFILLEVPPDAGVLKQYGIPRAAVVRIKRFKNIVTWKGQTIELVTETAVLDPDLRETARFESRGVSDAKKVFAKKGGPELNLNAALEGSVLAIVRELQGWKP